MSGALHDALAVGVLQPLYRAYRRARASTRPQMAARDEGLRFREEGARWSVERRRDWALERLRFAVRRAARETPYYRELFARVGFDPRDDFGFEDYARLPVLERGDVRAAGDALLSQAVPRDRLRRDATGGSTGSPTQVWKGPEELGWGESGSEYFMRRLGLPAGSRTALLWGHHLDPVARSGFRDHARDALENQRWYDCFRLSPEVLRRYDEELERWRPKVIVAYAGALAALAEEVAASGREPRYPTRAFVTGAEKLHAHQRAAVERTFGRPVHERYGSRDAGLVGFQTDPTRTLDFEVDWGCLLVEPETADGGPASVLVTKLRADGMPMLRYRIGDLARFPADARPGEPAFVLHEVVGRDVDRLWLPDGRWIDGLSVPHMMKDFPVRDFQVAQGEDLGVEVRVVPTASYRGADGEAIVRTMAVSLPGVRVTIRVVDEIPRTKANKWRPVVSAVRKSVTGGVAR